MCEVRVIGYKYTYYRDNSSNNGEHKKVEVVILKKDIFCIFNKIFREVMALNVNI